MSGEQEKQFYQAIFYQTHDTYVIVRASDLRVVTANPAFQSLTGINHSQVSGLSLAELFDSDCLNELEVAIQACQSPTYTAVVEDCWVKNQTRAITRTHVTVSQIHVDSEPLILLVIRDTSEDKVADFREKTRRNILEQIAKGMRLSTVLESIVAIVENEIPDSRCSILLLDKSRRHLLYGAAPRLPEFYNQAIHGVEIGPAVGSCGTAAFTRKRVIVEDIETHPFWTPYRELANRAGLRSCWSDPILSSIGEVLGAFAIYHSKPQQPTRRELKSLALATDLASIAIERLQTQELLLAANQKLTQLFDQAPIGVIEWDISFRVIRWNTAAERIFGFSASEAVGQQASFIIPESAQQFVAPVLNELLKGRGGSRTINENIRKDGVLIQCDWYNASIRDINGNVVGVTSLVEDVSERKALEIALQESEERWRSIAENPFDFVVVIDRKYRYIYVNHTAPGINQESLLGQATPFDFVDIQYHPTMREAFQTTFETGNATIYEVYVSQLDAWYSSIVGPIYKQGEVTSLSILTREITEVKRDEAQQRKYQTQLQQVQKMESLGIMAGGIAHDFNNLLTSILGYSDLALLELPTSSPAHNLIGEAVKGARRAAELTMQMLAYSGKGRFVVEPINMSTLTEEMTRLLQISISKKCVLKYDLMKNLPSVEADATQMRQIIMNLIINASEAIGDHGGIIAASTGVMRCDQAYLAAGCLTENLSEGQYVYLEVSDNGCGMSEEVRAKIFDPFFTTKFTGRGLGLSAVLGIVRGHRGALMCDSKVGEGTTFRVLFPAAYSSPAKISGAREKITEWCGSGTVLIVDDEKSVLELASHMFEKMGFTVLTAADGEECVDIFRSEGERIRLVLLDMTMARLDGEATLRELLSIRRSVRAILSSGYDAQSATSRFEGSGLAGFIQKPYRFAELVAVVRTALGEDGGIRGSSAG